MTIQFAYPSFAYSSHLSTSPVTFQTDLVLYRNIYRSSKLKNNSLQELTLSQIRSYSKLSLVEYLEIQLVYFVFCVHLLRSTKNKNVTY